MANLKTWRLPCAVPGCGCTVRVEWEPGPDDTGLCRKHWPLVHKRARSRFARIKRQATIAQARGAPWTDEDGRDWLQFGSREEYEDYTRLKRVLDYLWKRATRHAIERALGLR
jgi:hypothetical protein